MYEVFCGSIEMQWCRLTFARIYITCAAHHMTRSHLTIEITFVILLF